MPVIQPYEDQIVAQGGINSQATPGDFGAQVGQSMQQVGQGLVQLADAGQKLMEMRDTTKVHTEMAKARVEWTQHLQERANTAVPGDTSFAPKVMSDMDEWFSKGAESTTTSKGRRLWESMASNMSSEFGQRAVSIQGQLAAQEASNQHTILAKSSASAVFTDASQLDSVLASARAAIHDPSSIYGQVPAPARDEFLKKIEKEVRFAAVSGIAQRDPELVLKSVAPDKLVQFKPWQPLIDSFLAPGAKLNVKPEVEAKAPEFLAEASAKGLAPNVLMAQADIGADDQSPKDLAATMGVLTDKFGGDMGKALTAYHWGAENLNQTMENWQENWEYHIPANTAEYVNTVMLKSGSVVDPDAPIVPAASVQAAQVSAQTPAVSSIPGFSQLSWEEQSHILKESVQLQHTRMTMAIHARQEAEIQKKEAQEGIMNTMLQKIVEPKKYGRLTSSEVLADQTIDWKQKQHMVDYMLARSRELQSASEARTNPGEVRKLMLRVHAADTDPSKIYSHDPIMERYAAQAISTPEMMLLRREVDQMNQGGGSFEKEVHRASQVVYDRFMKSVENLGSQMQGVASEAWYRFDHNLREQIQAKRDLKENPRSLLDPKSSEYMLGVERTDVFMKPKKDVLEQMAAATVKEQAGTLPTRDKAKPGEQYLAPDGSIRTKAKEGAK